MPRIVLIDNGRLREIALGQELTIGRAYSNLLRLEGDEISRVHAIIYRRGDQYVVRDLDSKNGVWVNGIRVANRNLQSGDQLQVGEYRVFFDPPPDHDFGPYKNASSKNGADQPLSPARGPARSFESSHVFSADEPQAGENEVAGEAAPPDVSHTLSYLAPADEIDELLHPSPSAAVVQLWHEWWVASTGRTERQPVRANQGLGRLLEAAVFVLKADRGVIIYRSEDSSNLSLGGIYPDNKDVAVNRVVLKNVLKDQSALFSNDAIIDPRFSATETVKREQIRAMMAYPLLEAGRASGLIYIDSQQQSNLFDRNSLAFLALLSRLVTTFIPHDKH